MLLEPFIRGQIHRRHSTLMQKHLVYFSALENVGEWEVEICRFSLHCLSVSIYCPYQFPRVLWSFRILQLSLIANYGGYFESIWHEFWTGPTDERRGILRGFLRTSMTSSVKRSILVSEPHSHAKDEEDKDLTDPVFNNIMHGDLTTLPTLLDTSVVTVAAARTPRTRSETCSQKSCPAMTTTVEECFLLRWQCQKKRATSNPKSSSSCQIIAHKIDITPPLVPVLHIREQGQSTVSVAAPPKAKRKYQRRAHTELGQGSSSSSRSRGNGQGHLGSGLRDGESQKQRSMTPHVVDDCCKCSESAVPRPSVFFTPLSTRSSRRYKRRGGHNEITRNLFVDEQSPLNFPLEVPARSCLVKIPFINMQWGGEVLENPCGFAFGRLLEIVVRADDGDAWWRCDFGGDFGIQIVAQRHCEVVQEENLDGDNVDGNHGRDGIEGTRGGGGLQLPGNSTKAVTENARNLAGADRTKSLKEVQVLNSSQVVEDDLSTEDEWQPNIDDLCSSGDNYSDGDSADGIFPQDNPTSLLGELGLYSEGPREEDEEFLSKYSEENWHAKSWSLLPRHVFTGPTPGPTGHLGLQLLTPVDYILLIWNEQVQQRIVYYSNAYADYVDPKSGKRKGGVQPSVPITLHEYRQFCGIAILMGIKKQPAIRDYWQRVGNSLHCASIASTMSCFWFEHILHCVYMVPKGSFVTDKQDPSYDPLGKCRWILDAVTTTFKALWNPGPYVSIDECMIGYNGKYCSFKQYMPLKPITHGIKLWVLADSKTKLVWNMEVYVGAGNERRQLELHSNPMGMGAAVVTRLTAGLDGMFYRVAMDNFFTSVKLFDNLLQHGFYAIGTTQQQRKGFPSSLNMSKQESRGSFQVRVHRDRQIAAIHWQDTKGVHFLSTSEDPVVSGGVSILRNKGAQRWEIPTSPIQLKYSEHMRGVDVSDQLRGSYSLQIATKKWWHHIYFFAMDTALTNAYIMYREACRVRGVQPKIHRDFNLEVAYCLMGLQVPKVENVCSLVPPRQRGSSSCPSVRPGAAHLPLLTPKHRVCFVCKKRTSFVCQKCRGTHLCKENCFEYYHESPPTL